MMKGNVEQDITFNELWQKADAFSVALKKKGFKKGQRAIVMVPMSFDLYIVLIGIIKMGGVAVFVDPWVTIKKLVRFCESAEPRCFIGISKSHLIRYFSRSLLFISLTITTGGKFFSIPARHCLGDLIAENQGDGNIEQVTAAESALITFTSGSSGLPKGANRTHGFLIAQYRALNQEFPFIRNDIQMTMFPVFALRNLANQTTTVIPDLDFKNVAGFSPEIILKQITNNNVANCIASPVFFDRLADHLLVSPIKEFSIKSILTGGAPVSVEQLLKWHKRFIDAEIKVVYGSTEAEPVAHITADEKIQCEGHEESYSKGFCIGKPIGTIQAKLIHITRQSIPPLRSWDEMEVDEGQIGELIVRGEHVCLDYFENSEAVMENKLQGPDGMVWHRMGDTGFFDESGRFWLVGRVYSTISRLQEKYHAHQVEQYIIKKLMNVERVAALGIDDIELGEQLVLVIEVAASKALSKDTVIESLGITFFLYDKIIITHNKLPVDPRHKSKIDYKALHNLIMEGEL
jgi:acyl-CoA synthetase (AMP-forming)/AMP-acid ligase II